MNAQRDPRDGADPGTVRRRQLLLFSGVAALVLVAVAAWLGMGGGKAPAPRSGIEAGIAGPDTPRRCGHGAPRPGSAGSRPSCARWSTKPAGSPPTTTGLRAKLETGAADARTVIDRQAAMIGELERRLQPPRADGQWPGQCAGRRAGWRRVFPGAGDSALDRRQRTDAARRAPGSGAGTGGAHDRDLRADGQPRSSAHDPRSGPELVADAVAKPVSAWLPAGAHAEAVVLAGVDASAGISSQGDPRPVLMRITGPAWTAAEDGMAMQVDIDGCTVTGAAHGDLSSEKVYVRFRTMTCRAAAGHGGRDAGGGVRRGSGKTGVRGPVVSREGALVEKAFLAGVVSGVGQGVSQAFQPQAVATGGGAAVANAGLGEIGRAGLGAGASSAGQKVADYMIRRAEQYQPVIQLQAGTKVTLVFLEGARIDGRAVQPRQTQTSRGGK